MQRSNLDMLNQSATESNKTFEKTYKAQSYEMNRTLQAQQQSVSGLDNYIRYASETRFRELMNLREEYDKQLIAVFEQYKQDLEAAAFGYGQRFTKLKERADAVRQQLSDEQKNREESLKQFYSETKTKIDELYQRLSEITKIEHENSQRIYDKFGQVIQAQAYLLSANKQEAIDGEHDLYVHIDELCKGRMDALSELKREILQNQKKAEDAIEQERQLRQNNEKHITEQVNRIFERIKGSVAEASLANK